MTRVAVLGSVSYDHTFVTDDVPAVGVRSFGRLLASHVGGTAANQALQVANCLGDALLIGSVGDDDDGRSAVAALREHRIDTGGLSMDPSSSTGQAYGFVAEGDWFGVVVSNANARVDREHVGQALGSLSPGDYLSVQLEINADVALHALRIARRNGIRTVLSPSPVRAFSAEMLEDVDVLIVNQHEAHALWGSVDLDSAEAMRSLVRDLGVRHEVTVVVTRGSKGLVAIRDGEVVRVPAPPVTPVSTIGAGDALTGAFVSFLALGASFRDALVYGTIAGSIAVSRAATPTSMRPFPSLDDLQDAYRKAKPFFDAGVSVSHV